MPIGGVARRATVIKQARAEGKLVLVLDAGNSLLNDKHPAKASRGATSIALMNLMGYDAMTLGGLDLTLLTVDELRQRIAEAEFPVLSANVHVSGETALLAEPYTIVDVAGRKVAILGISDPLPAPVPADVAVTVTDPVEAARDYVPKLLGEADIVILLSHAGVETDREIAAQVPGIDVIVSGRNLELPEALVLEPNGTLLIHADKATPGLAGERIGKAELGFDKKGRLAQQRWLRIVLDTNYADDPDVISYQRAQGTGQ